MGKVKKKAKEWKPMVFKRGKHVPYLRKYLIST
jgi:hypothetical protein